jgi:hypothetical protein
MDYRFSALIAGSNSGGPLLLLSATTSHRVSCIEYIPDAAGQEVYTATADREGAARCHIGIQVGVGVLVAIVLMCVSGAVTYSQLNVMRTKYDDASGFAAMRIKIHLYLEAMVDHKAVYGGMSRARKLICRAARRVRGTQVWRPAGWQKAITPLRAGWARAPRSSRYYRDVLRRFIGASEDGHKRSFVFRRDPRDISTIYFWDPEVGQ